MHAALLCEQVALLKESRPEKLSTTLEISTVDGFQGREKEAIVISMVRRYVCMLLNHCWVSPLSNAVHALALDELYDGRAGQ